MSEEKILVPATEAARMLSMGESTFWRKVREHVLPQPVKIGGMTRWRVAELQRVGDQASQPTTASAGGAA